MSAAGVVRAVRASPLMTHSRFGPVGSAAATATIRRRSTTTRPRSTCRRSCGTSDVDSSVDDHDPMLASDIPLTTFSALASPAVAHGVTTRAGGVSIGPYASLNLGASVGDAEDAVA